MFPVKKISLLGRSYCFSAEYKYAKFHAKTTVLNFVGRGFCAIVSSCLRGYFMCPKSFPVGILLIQDFFLCVFCASKNFSCEYFCYFHPLTA